MNRFFLHAENYLPGIIWVALWLLALLPRLFVLMLLPPGATRRCHPLHRVGQFFALDRRPPKEFP